MNRIIRVAIAIIAISLSSASIAAYPRQTFIVEEDFNFEELQRVKTIALLEIPDPLYYNFAEDVGGAATFFSALSGLS